MKLAKVIISFEDLEDGVLRKAEDEFVCEDQRAEYLEALGLVWLKGTPTEKPKSKKNAKKAK